MYFFDLLPRQRQRTMSTIHHNHPPTRLAPATTTRTFFTLFSAISCFIATSHAQNTNFNKHPLGAMAFTQSNGLFYIQGGEYGPGTPNGECVVSQFFAFDLTKPWPDLTNPAYYNLPSSDTGAVMNSYHVATHSLDNKKVFTLGWNSGAHRSCITEPGSGEVSEGSGIVQQPTSLIMKYDAASGDWSSISDPVSTKALTDGWRDFQGALSPVSGRYLILGGNAGVNGTDKRNQQLVLNTASESITVKPIPTSGPAILPSNTTFSAGPSRTGYAVAFVKGGKLPGWYVLGGKDLNTGASAPFTSIEVLQETDTMNEWSKTVATGKAPTGRDRHCVASDDTRIFVYGGFVNESANGDLYILDTTTMVWDQITAPGAGPAGYAACTLAGNQFIVWGGFTDPNGRPAATPASALKVFDVGKNSWTNSYTPTADFSNMKLILPPGLSGPNGGTNNGGNKPGTPGGGNSGGGGSNGALIGGAAGGAAAVIMLAVVAFLFIRRRKRRTAHSSKDSAPPPAAAPRKSKDAASPPSLPRLRLDEDHHRDSTASSIDPRRYSKEDPGYKRNSAAVNSRNSREEEFYLSKIRHNHGIGGGRAVDAGDHESISGSKEDLAKREREDEAIRRRLNDAEAASIATDRRSRAQSEQFTTAPYASEYLLIPLSERGTLVATRPHSSSSDLLYTHPNMTPRWSMVVHPNSASQQTLPTVPEARPMVAVVPATSAAAAGYTDSGLNSANSHLNSRLVSWYGTGTAGAVGAVGADGYQRPPPPLPPGAIAAAQAHAQAQAAAAAAAASGSTASYESSSDPISTLTSGLTSFPDTSAPLSPIPPSYPPPPPLLRRENHASPQFVPYDTSNRNPPTVSQSPPVSPPVSPPFGAISTNMSGPPQLPSPTAGPVMTWGWPWPASGPGSTGITHEAIVAAIAAQQAAAHSHGTNYTPHLRAVPLPSIETPLPSGSLPSGSLPSGSMPTTSFPSVALTAQQQYLWDLAAQYKVPASTELPATTSAATTLTTTATTVSDETESSVASSSPSRRISSAPQQQQGQGPSNFP